MKIGVCMFATDYAIRIDELARAAEDRGFESLFVPEHTHIPVSRRTPFPAGGPLPKEYSHTFDPFVSLMAAAAVTKKIRIGIALIEELGPETIMWGSDFPHPDGIWPDSQEFLERELSGVSAEGRRKITRDNAMKLYRLSNELDRTTS